MAARRPAIANKFTLRFDPAILAAVGPLVPANWEVPGVQVEALRREGKACPPPVGGLLLLDTGAQTTCISQAAALTLGLQPISKVRGFGAGGEHINDLVRARLRIAIRDHRDLVTQLWWELNCQAIPHMEKHLARFQHGDNPAVLVGLLGRDILSLATVMYNGKKGTVEVIFDPEWIRSKNVSASLPPA